MKKKMLIFILIIFIIIICILLLNKDYTLRIERQEKLNDKIKKENLITEIKSSFNKYVITNKETVLYKLESNEFKQYGKISKGFELSLEEPDEISYDTKYFLIEKLGLYINYKDIDKIDSLTKSDKRYKKYIVFNENIISKEKVTLYKNENTYIILNQIVNLPIIIKGNDKYYVEFNNELFYVKKQDIEKIKNNENSKEEFRTNIRTLTYHTIYNPEKEKCTNTVICHPISQFEEHMKYLSENNYLTLTMEELEMFLDKRIQVPKKSIVVTLDDGKYAINAVNIVEKYKVNATYFIITSRYDVSKIKTTYMDFQPHTHNLHNNWKCSGGNQGGQLLCENEDKILEDLKISKEKLGGAFALAYPFFDFNERAIDLLKKSGFRLAFVGQYDTDGYSYFDTDKFKLRRKTVFSTDSINKFINYLR